MPDRNRNSLTRCQRKQDQTIVCFGGNDSPNQCTVVGIPRGVDIGDNTVASCGGNEIRVSRLRDVSHYGHNNCAAARGELPRAQKSDVDSWGSS